jgi:hypothetical protein
MNLYTCEQRIRFVLSLLFELLMFFICFLNEKCFYLHVKPRKKFMMKKSIVLVFVALMLGVLYAPLNAQVKFGVKGGVNIASVHFSDDVIDPNNVTGYHIGPMIEAMIPVTGLGIDVAVLYSQKGLEFEDESMKTDYIDVPVNLKWKTGVSVAKLYVAAGPYLSFRAGGDKKWDLIESQIEAKSFGAGVNLGAGVELLNHLQVGVNYGIGLTDNYSVNKVGLDDLNDGKNRTWSITAAILF